MTQRRQLEQHAQLALQNRNSPHYSDLNVYHASYCVILNFHRSTSLSISFEGGVANTLIARDGCVLKISRINNSKIMHEELTDLCECVNLLSRWA